MPIKSISTFLLLLVSILPFVAFSFEQTQKNATTLALTAAHYGHYKTLKIALKYLKADPNACDNNKTPLICIIAQNYAETKDNYYCGLFEESLKSDYLKCFLKLCAQPHVQCAATDKEGNTALHFLALKIRYKVHSYNRRLFDCITLLIQRGCSPHIKNHDNLSAQDIVHIYEKRYRPYGRILTVFTHEPKQITGYYKKVACAAAQQGDHATLKMCLKYHKISPNAYNKERIPLLSQIIQFYTVHYTQTVSPAAESIITNYTKCIMALMAKKHKLSYNTLYKQFILKNLAAKVADYTLFHRDLAHTYTLLLRALAHTPTKTKSFPHEGIFFSTLVVPQSTYNDMAYKAACAGHFDILNKCIKYYNVDPSISLQGAPLICHVTKNYFHATTHASKDHGPFGCSYESNYFICLTKLCSRPSKIDMNATDSFGNTALHCLIMRLYQLHIQNSLAPTNSFYQACSLLLFHKIAPCTKNAHNQTARTLAVTLLPKQHADTFVPLLKTYEQEYADHITTSNT